MHVIPPAETATQSVAKTSCTNCCPKVRRAKLPKGSTPRVAHAQAQPNQLFPLPAHVLDSRRYRRVQADGHVCDQQCLQPEDLTAIAIGGEMGASPMSSSFLPNPWVLPRPRSAMQSLDPSYSTQANGLERRVSPLTALQLPQNLRCCLVAYIYIGLSRLFRGSSWRFFTGAATRLLT